MKTSKFCLAIRPYFGWRQWSVVYNSWYRTWPRYTPGQQRGEWNDKLMLTNKIMIYRNRRAHLIKRINAFDAARFSHRNTY